MNKKKRDYALLLLFMITSFISITVVNKMYPPHGFEMNWRGALGAWTTIGWYVFLYRVAANAYRSKWIRGSYAAFLVFQFFMTSFVNIGGYYATPEHVVVATVSYLTNLIGFGIVFYIVLKDVFTENNDLTQNLLGATNIYFLIALIFSYLYALVAVHDPILANDSVDLRTLLFNCFDYGWYIIAGIDYPGQSLGTVIQSISVLEAISANLFIVFIIGRLMSKKEN